MLLDTGSETGLLVAMTAIRQHDVETEPRYNLPDPVYFSQLGNPSITKLPCKVKLLLEGNQRAVEAQIVNMHEFSGVMGTNLLLNRRITIDVIENGAVEIDWIPSPTRLERFRNLIHRPKQRRFSSDYPTILTSLPWAEVTIKDSEGRRHTLWANVDSGNNGELTLPCSEVERFGYRLLERCWVDTMDGIVDASCGEVEMIWQGKSRAVQCIQRSDVDRPIIGMKLLSGNRMTVDFDGLAPIAKIAHIHRSALPKFNCLWERFNWFN